MFEGEGKQHFSADSNHNSQRLLEVLHSGAQRVLTTEAAPSTVPATDEHTAISDSINEVKTTLAEPRHICQGLSSSPR